MTPRILLCASAVLGLAAFASRPQPAPTVIRQSGRRFSQAEVTLPRGSQLVFRNDDRVIHNVFSSTEGMSFNLRSQRPGTETAVTLEHPGDAEVRCAFHPGMRLLVHVR